MSSIRLAVDAVIEHEDALLLIDFEDAEFGRHFGLPGGGVEAGETIHQALRREVREETGAMVDVGSLLLVNEYDPVTHNYFYGDEADLRLVFRCRLQPDTALETPTNPDKDQLGIAWISLMKLATIPLYPRIGSHLLEILTTENLPDLFNTDL